MRLSLAAAFAVFASLASANPDAWEREWPNTNFDQTSISDWSEIMSGGPPKDGIPAIDNPTFIDVYDEYQLGRLSEREPVITLELKGETPRAYPIRYLMWHEIVNDDVRGLPVAVTFCPLCNSGITFDRRVEQGTLTFGVSGKLRNSDMVMFDRETESWWQQAIGEAIVGDLTGVELQTLPSWMESWGEFKERNRDGLVMDEPNTRRNYGANPYVRYDSSDRPFLYRGEMPPHGIAPLMRVVRVGDAAWPMTRLAQAGELTESGITFTWTGGQASALDTQVIGDGRDVGTIRVRDAAGNDLAHDVMFAFAFHAFWPEGDWMIGE